MKKVKQIQWYAQPEPHNFPAAKSYLSLIFDEGHVRETVAKLKKAKLVEFKAKDVFIVAESEFH